jgi:hypothetical protein
MIADRDRYFPIRTPIPETEHAKRLACAACGGLNPARFHRFAYDSREWSRLEAWQHLTEQQIPGAPQHSSVASSRVPWRKAHNEARHEWAWIYVG